MAKAKRKPAKKATTTRKPVAKKATARKTAAKKAPARKTAAKRATAKKTTRKTAAKKPVAKKTAAKKATARKPAAKKVTAKKQVAFKPANVGVIKKKLTKTQTLKLISECCEEISAKQAGFIMETLRQIAHGSMKKGGCGEFTIPELGIKIRRARKKATKGRMGRNPRTGEEVWIEAKPARTVIRLTALKALKEAISSQ